MLALALAATVACGPPHAHTLAHDDQARVYVKHDVAVACRGRRTRTLGQRARRQARRPLRPHPPPHAGGPAGARALRPAQPAAAGTHRDPRPLHRDPPQRRRLRGLHREVRDRSPGDLRALRRGSARTGRRPDLSCASRATLWRTRRPYGISLSSATTTTATGRDRCCGPVPSSSTPKHAGSLRSTAPAGRAPRGRAYATAARARAAAPGSSMVQQVGRPDRRARHRRDPRRRGRHADRATTPRATRPRPEPAVRLLLATTRGRLSVNDRRCSTTRLPQPVRPLRQRPRASPFSLGAPRRQSMAARPRRPKVREPGCLPADAAGRRRRRTDRSRSR